MRRGARTPRVLVNDIHSKLNATQVDRVVAVDSEAALAAALAAARAAGKPVCVAGGRHAMGGQQFAEGAVLIDTRPMGRILGLDAERGVVEVEAGIQWPELIHGLIAMQPAASRTGTHLGHHPEADRRRPALARRRARRQHPRPRPGAAADRRRGRGVHLDERRRQARHLQPHRERRALPPRHRRLRPVRHRHPRAPQADAADQDRARGADHRYRRSDVGSRGAHRRGLSLRRLPVLDRWLLGHLSAQGRVLVLSPAAGRRRDAGGAKGAGRRALARALLFLPRRHPARLRGLHLVLSVDLGTALLVGLPAS